MFLSLLDLMRQAGGLIMPLSAAAAPEIELLDGGDHLILQAQLQGIDPRSVQVQVSETSLAIGGRRSAEARTEGPDFVRFEATQSDFFRLIPLPCRVEPRRAESRWEPDGTMVVRLPKGSGGLFLP